MDEEYYMDADLPEYEEDYWDAQEREDAEYEAQQLAEEEAFNAGFIAGVTRLKENLLKHFSSGSNNICQNWIIDWANTTLKENVNHD